MTGVKWSATLWVWNGNPFDPQEALLLDEQGASDSVRATFVSRVGGYSLFWRDSFVGVLEEGKALVVEAFVGQSFHIYEGVARKMGPRLKTWTIDDSREQSFVFSPGSASREA